MHFKGICNTLTVLETGTLSLPKAILFFVDQNGVTDVMPIQKTGWSAFGDIADVSPERTPRSHSVPLPERAWNGRFPK